MATTQLPDLVPFKKVPQYLPVSYNHLRRIAAERRIEFTKLGGRNFLTPEQMQKLLVTVSPEGGTS